jgi:hypothetical protein
MHDRYGREITQSGNQFTAVGMSITADSPGAALRVFDSMAPEGQAPIQPAIWSPRDFMKRFTSAELAAIHVAKRTDVQVDILLSNALADDVHSDADDLINGMAYLVSVGLLTQQRSQDIIDPTK